MLMITFSPMSTRPSIVAEPMCGSSTTLPALREPHQLRVHRGLVLEHVEAGAGDVAGLEQLISASSSITSPRAVLTI